MRRVQQQGLGANAALFTDIVYVDGRVRGRHATAGATPAQVDTATIDDIVPQDVVDDNMLTHLLPALPWADDATWTFPYFSAGKRSLSTRTLRVTGAEQITVPAGTFETWRAEMALSDGNVVTFHVSRSAPHRLVRIGISAAPIEFVLVK